MKKRLFRLLLVAALSVCIVMTLPGLCASAENEIVYPAGKDIGNVLLSQTPTPVVNCTLTSGGLARGLRVTWNGSNIYLSGTPETAGDYFVEYTVETQEGNYSLGFSFTVSAQEETAEPIATAAPVSKHISITKHPTGETVEAGGSAKFIAKADNANKIVWKLVSPDTSNTIDCASADGDFPGLGVEGLGTDTLILTNIPKSMNNWCVECRFFNDDEGPVCSNGARIQVISDTPDVTPTPKPEATAAPSSGGAASGDGDTPAEDLPTGGKPANIVNQPHSAEIKSGESYVLSVDATSPNNGSLSYQWYSAATDKREAAVPISGAADEVYTVNQTEGSAFYWVAVWNTKDGKRSDPVYSEAAEVRIKAEVEATPEPTPTPEATPEARSSGMFNGNFQILIFGLIGLLALAALVGVIVYLRIEAKQERQEETRKKE